MSIVKVKNKKLQKFLSYIFLTLGAFIAAFALEFFLIPNSILDGGITGVSMIVAKLTPLNLSLLVIIFNIPFVFIGYKNLGLRFLVRTVYSIGIFSLALRILSGLGVATNQILLALVFGGVLLGLGVGIIMRAGGCVDGTESVALVISKKTSLSTGQVVLIFNLIIYSISAIFFGLDRAMFSLLTYFITFQVIDFVAEGLEQAKAALIITDKGPEITEAIIQRLGRSLTTIEARGVLTGRKEVLYCVLTRIEIFELKNIIAEVDDNAFVTILEVSEIIGLFYKEPQKHNKLKKKKI